MGEKIEVKVRKLYSNDYEPKMLELPDYLSKEQVNVIKTAIKTKTTILITGRQGPTGKTHLKRLLNSVGVSAVEETDFQKIELNEDISHLL